jgi:hypothetical protein
MEREARKEQESGNQESRNISKERRNAGKGEEGNLEARKPGGRTLKG